MRISDWSSDVCSSDLAQRRRIDGFDFREGFAEADDDARKAAIADDEVRPKTKRHHRDRGIEIAEEICEIVGVPRFEQPVGGAARLEPYERRSEEHTSELQSLMRIEHAVICLIKRN